MELQKPFIVTDDAISRTPEDVLPLCELAKRLEEAGEFEQAFDDSTLRKEYRRLRKQLR